MLVSLAGVLALWLGLTAPAQSPVAPVMTPQQSAAVGIGNTDQGIVQQVVPDDGRPGRGRR